VLSLALVDSRPVIAPAARVERMRASFCVLGPLVARRGEAIVPLPGGCAIGDRPVDLHLAGLAALGADVRIEGNFATLRAPRGLRGATLELAGRRGPTVTGTANVLMAATLARGVTIIRRAAREPEIVDLAEFLRLLGADIEGEGSERIVVRGVAELAGGEFSVIPDRIEAATLLAAAAISGSKLTVADVRPEHLTAILAALEITGQRIELGHDWVTLDGAERPRAGHFVTAPYPGLPSDFQPQLMALLAIADGESSITERVFPSRWRHAAELRRFGAEVLVAGARARIRGVAQLNGTDAMAQDLRGGAAIVLAALAAQGASIVHGLEHLNRGYAGLTEKLAKHGALIYGQPALDRADALLCPT
jgi:UDP-N-acetylglucosamine 1-carboxyvinyltransferase